MSPLFNADKSKIRKLRKLGSKRMSAEEAVRVNEKNSELIINTSPVGICTVDPQGNFITTNPAYEKMLGYTKDDLRGLSFFDVTHPEDRPENKERFQSMFTLKSTSFSMEKRYLRKDGKMINVDVHATGVKDAEGQIRFGTAFVRDITERRHAEETLKENEKSFWRIMDSLPLAIYIFTPEQGRECEYLNTTFTKLFGYTKDDVPNAEQWYQLAYPEDSYRKQIGIEWDEKIQTAKRTQSQMVPLETVVTCKDGSKKNILWGINASGATNYIYGLDLTELNRAQVEVAISEKQLQLAQSVALLGSWEQSIASEELFWSEMVYQLFGMDSKKEKLTIERFFEMVHPDDLQRVQEAYTSSLEPGGPLYDITHRIIRVDNGEIRYLHEACTHFRDTDGNVIKSLGTVQDVTEKKQAEIELEKGQNLLNTILNASPDMIWMKDPAGVFIMCNREFEKLAGVPSEKLIGATGYDFFSKEQADLCLEQDRKAARDKSMSIHEEPMWHATMGRKIWYETIKAPVYDNHGELLGVLGVGRNITNQPTESQKSP